ncbi:MAG: hypothetical protein NZ772_01465 [Cyanobacteria bacterium]|nr:hypothetical protein [Cyanobacteriota bacterium]MDW8200130.1 hypothetical protein [Cyanobacteriota bacterium SKYGB_h_bin112]
MSKLRKLHCLGSLIFVALMVTSLVTSCSSAHTRRVTQSSPKATASPIAQPMPVSPATQQRRRQATSSRSTSISPIALVQPTDSSQRAQHVEAAIIAGRSDPFAPTTSQVVASASAPPNSPARPSSVPQALSPVPGVPVPLSSPWMPFPPVVVTAPMPIAQPLPVTQLPALPPTPAVQPYSGSVTTPSPAPSPVSVPIPTAQPSVPIAPISLARRIQIMGVVQTKGKATAIVEVPGEGTSRTVSVGERLGNGSVLVKRIQANDGQEPIVVLEERGQEVFRAIGSAVISAHPDY